MLVRPLLAGKPAGHLAQARARSDVETGDRSGVWLVAHRDHHGDRLAALAGRDQGWNDAAHRPQLPVQAKFSHEHPIDYAGADAGQVWYPGAPGSSKPCFAGSMVACTSMRVAVRPATVAPRTRATRRPQAESESEHVMVSNSRTEEPATRAVAGVGR